MEDVKCCEQGRVHIGSDDGVWWMEDAQSDGRSPLVIRFCPFCGHDLSQPVLTLEEALEALLASPVPLRLCFDVDGILCDDSVLLPYAERPPYPWVASLLTRLKAAGHTIVIQTARYMLRYGGDQNLVHRVGCGELHNWLFQHGIPYDEAYMGKASADIYVDDRGCRVESNLGITEWAKSFVSVLAKTQAKKRKVSL